nr:HNH endonuclease signature motif containing protein [Geomicrobium sp. JCM 19038]
MTVANTVHHIKPRKDYPELALTSSNLESICPRCHNKEHPEKGKSSSQENKIRINVHSIETNPEIF